ncbi:hypothetical protein QVD17_31982 [Tagetes erecta]|uniref:Uncharacterized protein n=1 Tax=Tagetes erecta TaxID=13708 RepID=A0AAD8NPU0_TARER|nr:hypothetical protein QVD17_31982 [Tagetes erecta]
MDIRIRPAPIVYPYLTLADLIYTYLFLQPVFFVILHTNNPNSPPWFNRRFYPSAADSSKSVANQDSIDLHPLI